MVFQIYEPLLNFLKNSVFLNQSEAFWKQQIQNCCLVSVTVYVNWPLTNNIYILHSISLKSSRPMSGQCALKHLKCLVLRHLASGSFLGY